jgi:serpin B
MKQKIFLLSALLIPLLNFASEYENVAKLMTADNTFAFKLLKELNVENKSGNLFVSPYSAATALQMAANGASGQTKAEMEKVLETAGLTREELNAASKAAGALLNSPDTNIILTTANALWYRQSAEIRPEFLAENQKFFASTIKPLDFANVPAAEAAINQWASDQTRGRITGIANGLIDPLYTDLVLANAIYFKGKWLDPFEAKLTKDRPFHPATGAAREVPMMEMSKTFSYRKGSGYQAVRLPYQGGDLAMYVFLPDTNSSPTKLLQIMNGDNWRRITIPGFSDHEGLVVLPKFKLENTFDLMPPLQKLGLKTAFDRQHADFSGMFKDPHFISAVRQKTFVDVAEEGTEAAAVTVVAVQVGAIPEPNPIKPFEMIVDRPFLFTIVDARSEMILFMGVVNEL